MVRDCFSKAHDTILCMTEQMTLKKQTNEHSAVYTCSHCFLLNAHLHVILFPHNANNLNLDLIDPRRAQQKKSPQSEWISVTIS